MSVELPIERSTSNAHIAATDDVNRWRGHCLESFARLERDIGELLELMANALQPSRRNAHTFGEKLKALRLALSPGAPFADARILKALEGANALLEQRNCIVHATGRVWIDASGSWVWVYWFKPAGKSGETGLYEQKAARQFEVQLARSSQGLCARLKAFGQKLPVTK